MRSNSSHLTVRVPNPFDDSANIRLGRMGLFDVDGNIDSGVMCVFSRVFAGLFFDDLCDFYDNPKDLTVIYNALSALYEKGNFQHMLLLISIQYDYIRKPLPDPVWWLAGNTAAVNAFMVLFIKRLKALMTESKLVAPTEYSTDPQIHN